MLPGGSRASASIGALVLVLVVASAWTEWACLPDLAIAQSSTSSPSCGDGTVDRDAGEECDPGDAGAIGCAACKVQCAYTTGVVDPATMHCYFSLGLTQDEIGQAEPQCEAQSAHVVRFVSDAEMALVAARAPTDDIWVGLVHGASAPVSQYAPVPATSIEPGWSPTCSGCYAYVDAGAQAIPGTPAAENCIEIKNTPSTQWVTSACSGAKSTFNRETICEREPVGSRASLCNEGVCFTVVATADAKRYVLVPQKLASTDAVAACQSYGGRLAVFGSREEREQVAYEIAHQTVASPATEYWIGLATNAEGAWGWEGDAGSFAPSNVLGNLQSALDAGNVRAFALLAPGTLDSELARGELAGGAHDPLCEITY